MTNQKLGFAKLGRSVLRPYAFCGAETEKKIDRRGEQEGRRVEARRRPGKMNGSDGSAENREGRVTHSVQKHHASVEISERAKRARVAVGEGSQRKKDSIRDDETDQPFAKLKRGHREPGKLGTHGEHGRIVNGEEARRGFIEDVGTKSKAEQKPRKAKIAGVSFGRTGKHGTDCTTVLK
jgi:hypothetical protein